MPLAACATLIACIASPTLSQTIRGDLDGAYGPVLAMAQSADTLYVGGDFDHVGPTTSNVALLSSVTGRLLEDLDLRGPVRASIPDGNGGWFVAGFFTSPGRSYPRVIAHIRADGTLGPLDPESNGDVDVLANHGSTLYFGGNFFMMEGRLRARVAAWDLDADTLLAWDARIERNTSSFVWSLEVANGLLYMGGAFNTVGGQTRSHAAAVDLETAAVAPWNPMPDLHVASIAVGPSAVYLAGSFNHVSGQPRPWVAAVDPVSGAPNSWNPSPDYFCEALLLRGRNVFLGGRFRTIGGVPRPGFAAIDATSGEVRSWGPAFANDDSQPIVEALTFLDTTLYVGGLFTHAGVERRKNLAAIDTATGNVTAWNPGATGWVITLASDGATILAGGSFTRIGGEPRRRLAAIDLTSGRTTPWNPDANGAVRALAVSGGTVYAGGSFGRIGGVTRRALAAIDATSGQPRQDWNASADGTVRALALNGATLYVGGSFTQVNDQPRSRVAALDVPTGNVTPWQPDADSTVRAVVTSASRVYVGGDFNRAGGRDLMRVAALDSVSGSAFAWNLHAMGAGENVNALALQGSRLFAGGTFQAIGGQPRIRLASIDTSTGDASAWNPGMGKSVYAIAAGGESRPVYVGGGGTHDEAIAAIDAVTGAITAWRPQTRDAIYSLVTDGTYVHAGGEAGLFGITASGITSTLLAMFQVESRLDGIAIRWSPGGAAANALFHIERSETRSGPWSSLDLELHREGEHIVALDRMVEPGRSYHYRILVELPGGTTMFGPIAASFGASAPEFALTRVAPSPATGPTTIEFVVARTAAVRLEVLDVQGRLVARLVDETLRPGTWQAVWSGQREDRRAPPGIYFVRYTAGNVRATKRVVLTR